MSGGHVGIQRTCMCILGTYCNALRRKSSWAVRLPSDHANHVPSETGDGQDCRLLCRIPFFLGAPIASGQHFTFRDPVKKTRRIRKKKMTAHNQMSCASDGIANTWNPRRRAFANYPCCSDKRAFVGNSMSSLASPDKDIWGCLHPCVVCVRVCVCVPSAMDVFRNDKSLGVFRDICFSLLRQSYSVALLV